MPFVQVSGSVISVGSVRLDLKRVLSARLKRILLPVRTHLALPFGCHYHFCFFSSRITLRLLEFECTGVRRIIPEPFPFLVVLEIPIGCKKNWCHSIRTTLGEIRYNTWGVNSCLQPHSLLPNLLVRCTPFFTRPFPTAVSNGAPPVLTISILASIAVAPSLSDGSAVGDSSVRIYGTLRNADIGGA